MRNALSLFALPLALIIPVVCMAQNEDTQPAQSAAKAWLALTDMGKYAASWETAAALFKASVSKSAWEDAVRPVRSPLGALISRNLKSATFTRNLPGAPDGKYVVIQYETRFENKAAATETITPMHEKDGSWRVSGYFIK